MKTLKWILLMAGWVVFVAAWAQAQVGPERQRDRARTFLVVRLAEALDLSDEKALQVSRIVREGEKRRADLNAERAGVEEQIRQALQAHAAEADLRALVARANEIDGKLAMIPENSLREAQKILSVEEQAKMVLFRPELRDEVRGALRDRLRRRGDRPGPPAPLRQPPD